MIRELRIENWSSSRSVDVSKVYQTRESVDLNNTCDAMVVAY